MPPEGAVAAVGHLVMKDQEVADLGGIQFLLVVIFGDVARADATRRQHADEAQHRALDQIDRGRFQRLPAAARQADGYALATPLPPPAPGRDAQDIELGPPVALDVRQPPNEPPGPLPNAAPIATP